MAVYPKQKTTELIGLACLMSGLLLILALYSYNPQDGSWNVSTSSNQYLNYIGRTGAWLADFLFQIFGLASFLIPVVLFAVGFRQLRGLALDYPIIKTCGAVGTLITTATGFAILRPSPADPTPYAMGGVVGIIVASVLESAFNRNGALILVFFALLFALVLTTRFSFEALISWLSEQNWNPVASFRESFAAWKKRRQNRQTLKQIREDPRAVVNQPPVHRVHLGNLTEANGVESPGAPSRTLQFEEETDTPEATRVDASTYEPPSLEILSPSEASVAIDEAELMERAHLLTSKLSEFDVRGRVLQIHPGPVVTTFEFKPDPGVKYSRITSLVDDLCLALRAEAIRVDRIPGKNTVGIEVPNRQRQTIHLREVLASTAFQKSSSLLTLGLGKLINGNTFSSDLCKMPHLLIAGATGSGKSVAANCIVTSILYRASPHEVKFILIDPKRLELGLYEDIPHLLTPIVTDPKKAANALKWAVREMERRYKLLARAGVRNLVQYNNYVKALPLDEKEEGHEPLPLIVVIVDELADLMMTGGKGVEASLTRLAQMARAIGIHLILATQRPSVDVLTGLIKANFPCRISFRVASKIDSRTVIDMNGAEQLLGHGDMLFLSPLTPRPVRVHGCLVTEKETERIASFLRSQSSPTYQEDILESEEEQEAGLGDVEHLEDSLYDNAARFVVETGRASTSLLQRRLRIGYGRAARLLDMMEHENLISPPDGTKARKVLVPPSYFEEVDEA